MSYPKYDKEEAKRVYEDSLKKAGIRVPDKDDLLFTWAMILMFVTGLLIAIFLIGPGGGKPKPVPIKADIVVKSIRLSPGKYPDIVVKYQLIDNDTIGYGNTYGSFVADEVYYGPGDTVRNISFIPLDVHGGK